jgi:ABC-type uncharacterized transport system involved in gliding motility auxiliary subunit
MGLAFLGILVVVNYLVNQNSKRWDLTEDKQNTLAPETVDTLKSLPQKVEAQAFFTRRISPEQAQGLLDQYKFHSDGQFDYRFIDPEEDPVAAREANITRDGTILVKMGDRQEQVTAATESEITGSLVRLMSRILGIYFTGHGERSSSRPVSSPSARSKVRLRTKIIKSSR